jgi:carbonic anhydrase/acetyltransferase-like protein (isoleucine patch superfamily)
MRQIRDFYVAPGAAATGDVVCGPGVNLWFGVVIRGDLARVTLGARVNLQDGCIVHTDYGEPQDVEEGVAVGHRAVLHGRRIGRDSLIGMGAILMAGSEIGPESVVAAGALVTEGKRFPPRSVILGAPARVVRPATDEDVRRTRAIADHYLELARRYARGEFPPLWETPS